MATKQSKMVWLETLKNARKSSLVQDGKRKLHYTFPDREMVEEYDIKTGLLLVRKWKSKTTLGADKKWEFEIGEDLSNITSFESNHISESKTNPIFMRKDTKEYFQWRIRNLPYTIDNYQVTIDENKKHIIIKTKNKKYYKKFEISDMVRNNLTLDSNALSFAHANNTLIIKYVKPELILQQESIILKELNKNKNTKDGDIECNPS